MPVRAAVAASRPERAGHMPRSGGSRPRQSLIPRPPVGALFTAAGRVVVNRQPNTGHNISLGRTAPAYHLSVLAFAEECAVARQTGEFTGPALQFDGGAPAPER